MAVLNKTSVELPNYLGLQSILDAMHGSFLYQRHNWLGLCPWVVLPPPLSWTFWIQRLWQWASYMSSSWSFAATEEKCHHFFAADGHVKQKNPLLISLVKRWNDISSQQQQTTDTIQNCNSVYSLAHCQLAAGPENKKYSQSGGWKGEVPLVYSSVSPALGSS